MSSAMRAMSHGYSMFTWQLLSDPPLQTSQGACRLRALLHRLGNHCLFRQSWQKWSHVNWRGTCPSWAWNDSPLSGCRGQRTYTTRTQPVSSHAHMFTEQDAALRRVVHSHINEKRVFFSFLKIWWQHHLIPQICSEGKKGRQIVSKLEPQGNEKYSIWFCSPGHPQQYRIML